RDGTERVTEYLDRVVLEPNERLHALERVTEEEACPLDRAEEIRYGPERRAAHLLEQDRRTARREHALVNRRHLEVRVDFFPDPHQVAVRLEIGDAFLQTPVSHSLRDSASDERPLRPVPDLDRKS